MRLGDLVKKRTGQKCSRHVFEVIRGPYTARFMEQLDYEMEAAGLGDMSGVYASAIDVMTITGPDIGEVLKKKKAKHSQ